MTDRSWQPARMGRPLPGRFERYSDRWRPGVGPVEVEPDEGLPSDLLVALDGSRHHGLQAIELHMENRNTHRSGTSH
jgi:hypothetical protein